MELGAKELELDTPTDVHVIWSGHIIDFVIGLNLTSLFIPYNRYYIIAHL